MKLEHVDYDLGPGSLIQKIAHEGILHAVKGLSQMVGSNLSASEPRVSVRDLLDIPNILGGPETEAVGVYLKAEGQMAGQFMLIFPVQKALEMVDLLMGEAPGTTRELEGMGRSALAEVGNLTGAFFLNAVASLTMLETVPSPPAVMFDMVGAIMNVIIATCAEAMDQVIMIETSILDGERDVEAIFWYIPDPQVLMFFEKN